MKIRSRSRSLQPVAAAAFCSLLPFLPLVPAWGEIPEPETICYGKVLNVGSQHNYALSNGTLSWTIGMETGEPLTFSTELRSLANGEFSYQLKIPHEALSLGLLQSQKVIPLSGDESSLKHSDITVDGLPARILPPADDMLFVYQARRAATQRIDLAVGFLPDDSDGDGLPDWWEDRHGLDKQLADADDDPDGDGLNNLAEFHSGSDPNEDNRTPVLLTSEIQAYADGTSGVLLHTLDSDSAPAQLVYTLTGAPSSGVLYLRNNAPRRLAARIGIPSDLHLESGTTFTQDDVNQGRLIIAFKNDDNDNPPRSVRFKVTVRDEDPNHAADSGEVTVKVYRPDEPLLEAFSVPMYQQVMASLPVMASGEHPYAANFILSKHHGFTIWDGSTASRSLEIRMPTSRLSEDASKRSFLPRLGEGRAQVLLGGSQSDHLSGGMADDILIGDMGDDVLSGGGGADQFVFLYGVDGDDQILDFNPEEGDLLDLSELLQGESKLLSDYLVLSTTGNDTVLAVDADGDRSGYTDVMITLVGQLADATALADWLEKGNLIVDGLFLSTQVTVTPGTTAASENGQVAGLFRLSRSGSLESALTVHLSMGGSATNGVDYARIGNTVTFPVGAQNVSVTITPFADSTLEPEETVELILEAGEGYQVTEDASRATLTIEDLKVQLDLEVLEALAEVDSQSPARFLLRRSGVLDRSVFVRLEFGGTASMGTDYQTLTSYIELAAGETSRLLEITPTATASLTNGVEFVEIRILSDDSYRLGKASRIHVTMVDRITDFQTWAATHFPSIETDDMRAFAAQDPDNRGIPNLIRYAFGMDPMKPDPKQIPRPAIRDGHLTIEFEPLLTAGDLEYVVEASPDMISWSASPEDVELVESSRGQLKRVFRSSPTLSESKVRFMRVGVIYSP